MEFIGQQAARGWTAQKCAARNRGNEAMNRKNQTDELEERLNDSIVKLESLEGVLN